VYEIHRHEQYFFDDQTLDHLAGFLADWPAPCCLCAPLLGQRLVSRGVAAAILDVDERFAALSGFRRYDLYRPEWIDREFDVILCDPPFFNVSLSQLFTAVRKLSHFRFDQPLMISYLHRRAESLLGTFAPFGMRPTGYHPTYQTVQACAKNDIEFFSNLPMDRVQRLCTVVSHEPV
jgi:hypothetical protein